MTSRSKLDDIATTTFPLMELPAELRVLIYNQLLIDTHRTPRFYAICLASKQVYSETEPILYTENDFQVTLGVKHGKGSPRVCLRVLVNGKTEMQKTYTRDHVYRTFAAWPNSLRKVHKLAISIDCGRAPLDLTKRALNHTLLGLPMFLDALSSVKTLEVALNNQWTVSRLEPTKMLWPLAAFGRRMSDTEISFQGDHTDLQLALNNSISGHAESSDAKDRAVEQLSGTLRVTARAVVRLRDAGYHTLVAKIDGDVLRAVGIVFYADGTHWDRMEIAERQVKQTMTIARQKLSLDQRRR